MDELLSAAARLGALWSTSPVIQTLVTERTSALTHKEGEPPKPYQQALSMFLTSGSFNTQPLLIGWWLPGMPQLQSLTRMPEANDFVVSATRTAGAYLLLIEWLRSWLPGYPLSFRLPHLDPLASRVIRRGFPSPLLPWPLELRRMSLNAIPEIDDQLAPALALDRAVLTRPLLDLRQQLWASPAWQEFVAARAALDDEDRLRLNTLVDQFRADCRAFAQSTSERLMLDDASRRAAVARCEDAAVADDHVARYYETFRAIDRLIEAVGALITQFAIGEGVVTVRPAQITWRRGVDPEIRFVLVNESGAWLRVNQVVHVETPEDDLQCLARMEGSTVNWDNQHGELSRFVGPIVALGKDATPGVKPPMAGGDVLDKIRRAERER